MMKQFGKAPSGKRLERIKQCENYKDGSFKNIEETSVNPNNVSMFKMMKDMRNRPKSVNPSKKIPFVQVNESIEPIKRSLVPDLVACPSYLIGGW